MRKQKLMLILLVSGLILSYGMSIASSSASSSIDWTMFRNDPSHSGSTIGNSSMNSTKFLWNFTTMYNVESSPAIANGYVFSGDDGGQVYCINSSTGQLLWYYSTGGEVISSPAVVDGAVYVGSRDGSVYGLNDTNGAKLWSYVTGNSVDSSPVVVDGSVYVGSGDGSVYSLNATDGAKFWSYSTGGAVTSSPAIVNGVVYIGSVDDNVYALNATDGSKIWSCLTRNSVESSPAVSNGSVYVGSTDGYVYSLNASTGDLIWKYQTQDAVDSSPAVDSGHVYVGSEDNNVYCLNASNGEKIWQSPTGYWVYSSPAIADGKVYVGSEDYSIYCLNASTGVKEWSYATENIVDSSPAISNGILYVGSDDGHIYAFALSNSGSDTVALQFTHSLPVTVIVFDVTTCSVLAVIIFLILLFVRSNKAKQNVEVANLSNQNVSWVLTHADALCIVAILAFSTIFFINLGNGPLWPSDEQWYSQWAFYMVRTGHYLTPWAFGMTNLWIAKPPLNMWLISLAYQIFGVNNFASRFFGAVLGSLSLVLVFYLGKKLYNRYVGLLSALVLGTFTTFYVFSRLAMTDIPLVFFMLGSIYFFVLSEKSENANRYAIFSGLFFGLALMTKQVEALLIPLILISYLVATKVNLRFFFTKRFTLFWTVGLLVFSPWLIYMNMSFGLKFWQWYFIYTDVTRTVSPVEGHSAGVFYYFSYLVNRENLLWVILLPFATGLCVFNAFIKRLKEDTLILLWMAIVLSVFTFAQTKLYWYILPVTPAFAIAISSLLYQLSKKAKKFQLNRKIQRSKDQHS